MEKRRIIFGSYDTALDGPWTLTGWTLGAPEPSTNFVEVPGRKRGPINLSNALTDGEPRYGTRTLTATFESSEGTRLEREASINTMINWLDGWTMNIELPDDPEHYVTGLVHVVREYNDQAHAAVTVTATCEPWRYNLRDTVHTLPVTAEAQVYKLTNYGRLTVSPLLEISGTGASVNLVFGSASWVLGPGVYQLPDLVVPSGGGLITYSGSGELRFTYREALL